MKNIKVIIFAAVLVILPQYVHGGWLFGPKNSQECIQKYQKEAKSKLAARVIHTACDNKFNKKSNTKYSDCLLEHVVKTKSDLAVKLIAAACSNLHTTGVNKKYSQCILKNMPGVDVDMSARSIASSCK